MNDFRLVDILQEMRETTLQLRKANANLIAIAQLINDLRRDDKGNLIVRDAKEAIQE